MRSSAATALLAIAAVVGAAPCAAIDINEVGAVLVYPTVINESTAAGPTTESFVTVENAGAATVGARVFLVDGVGCGWCDVATLTLTGSDSDTLRFTRNTATGLTDVSSLDGATTNSCPGANGYVVIVAVNDATGQTLTDNVLFGSSIVRNVAEGTTTSTGPISIQGQSTGDGDLNLEFDDLEYGKLPRVVAGTAHAPDLVGGIDVSLSLFTLNYNRGTPPQTECSLTATDENGDPVSRALQFGCWTHVDLLSISPDLGYPDWGIGGESERIFFQLACGVRIQPGAPTIADGGVHGALNQSMPAGTAVRRQDPSAPTMANAAAWSRPLIQSITTGDATRISAEVCNGIDDDLDTIVDEGCDFDQDGYCVAALGFDGEPAGCTAGVDDCNDADAFVYPDAPEVNDGVDNQCPGDTGFGLTDEIDSLVFNVPGDKDVFCWTPQSGATQYEAVRAEDPTFPAFDCAFAGGSDTCVVGLGDPIPGQIYFFLVRSALPNTGSYGAGTLGERVGVCL